MKLTRPQVPYGSAPYPVQHPRDRGRNLFRNRKILDPTQAGGGGLLCQRQLRLLGLRSSSGNRPACGDCGFGAGLGVRLSFVRAGDACFGASGALGCLDLSCLKLLADAGWPPAFGTHPI